MTRFEIRSIKTEEDHAWAVGQIGKFWGSEEGTPEFKNLMDKSCLKKVILGVFLLLALSGCLRTNLDGPEIIYKSETSIGVRYGTHGFVVGSNEREAMELIKRHCNNRFRVIGRTNSQIDAECQ